MEYCLKTGRGKEREGNHLTFCVLNPHPPPRSNLKEKSFALIAEQEREKKRRCGGANRRPQENIERLTHPLPEREASLAGLLEELVHFADCGKANSKNCRQHAKSGGRAG